MTFSWPSVIRLAMLANLLWIEQELSTPTDSGLRLPCRQTVVRTLVDGRLIAVANIHCASTVLNGSWFSPTKYASNRPSRITTLEQLRWTVWTAVARASQWPWNSWPVFTYDSLRFPMMVGISLARVGRPTDDVTDWAARRCRRRCSPPRRPRRWSRINEMTSRTLLSTAHLCRVLMTRLSEKYVEV